MFKPYSNQHRVAFTSLEAETCSTADRNGGQVPAMNWKMPRRLGADFWRDQSSLIQVAMFALLDTG